MSHQDNQFKLFNLRVFWGHIERVRGQVSVRDEVGKSPVPINLPSLLGIKLEWPIADNAQCDYAANMSGIEARASLLSLMCRDNARSLTSAYNCDRQKTEAT